MFLIWVCLWSLILSYKQITNDKIKCYVFIWLQCTRMSYFHIKWTIGATGPREPQAITLEK